MGSSLKNVSNFSDSEIESQDLHLQSKIRSLRIMDSVRLGLTVLALLCGITVLGVSGDALSVYNNTHVSQDFLLPLWPDSFDVQPTVALVAGSTVVMLTNIVSLLFGKVPKLRNWTPVHTSLTFVAPLIGLTAAVIAIGFFYSANASETEETLLSWACRWQVLSMEQSPHFGTLCRESWAGVYLSVLLIPIEFAILAVAGWQLKVERHTTAYATARKGSPVMGSDMS